MVIEYSWLIPLLPLISFVVIAAVGKKTREQGGYIAVSFVGASFILSVLTVLEVMARSAAHLPPYETSTGWIVFQNFSLEMGILVDPLSALMLIVVSFVGLLVVVYSLGYMHGDAGLRRYFAEISLFIGVMLGLVLANNYLQVYMFWELVGLCSYLLIGFWYQKPSAASAAKKAFIVTRVGDIMFLVGIIILFTQFHTFNFVQLFEHAEGANTGVLTLATLLIFGGAVGKSAQFPLHVWLPDAMEGPTTVSALIHAATMVKAGVYLVARSYPLFHFAPDALLTVAVIGGITAILAASMGLVANDIKRVLAYSTISQLGYMMLALGVGAYTGAMFHLMNHAFFKALLFLCAGSVIHTVGTNDMREMGGLGKVMKITSITMLLGALSISGIPPFSGFWSKDEILAATYEHNLGLFVLAAITAFFTAFYMFRLWFMTFSGKYRGRGQPQHLHESPKVMTVPLMILASLAVVSGFAIFTGFSGFIFFGESHGGVEINYVVMPLSILIAVSGILLARAVYYKGSPAPEVFVATRARKALHRMLERKYWMDDLYIGFAEKVFYGFSLALDWFDKKVIDGVVNGVASATVKLSGAADWFDIYVIDGVVNGISRVTVAAGQTLRKVQTGLVQQYATVMLIGICALLILLGVLGW
jgi:NADH-quinone oxidoreductase subunit L